MKKMLKAHLSICKFASIYTYVMMGFQRGHVTISKHGFHKIKLMLL